MRTVAVYPKQLGFVGGGNMATALIRGVLEARLYRASEIWVADTAPEARRRILRRHGIRSAPGNPELVRGSRVVVLAVKPQILPGVLAELSGTETSHQLFISIAAGVPLRRIESALGDRSRVVRVMPNTPALLGKGMSVLVAGANARQGDLRLALRIFRNVGDALTVDDEALLDPVTGVSGSGPAYVYRFAEVLIESAVRQGLTREVASRLVFRTLEGASAMLLESGVAPKELREMVSSPGGTTLAGLGALDGAGFAAAVDRAVAAATARSRELGGG
jgi:pyrroline-5-carboxylate reductase